MIGVQMDVAEFKRLCAEGVEALVAQPKLVEVAWSLGGDGIEGLLVNGVDGFPWVLNSKETVHINPAIRKAGLLFMVMRPSGKIAQIPKADTTFGYVVSPEGCLSQIRLLDCATAFTEAMTAKIKGDDRIPKTWRELIVELENAESKEARRRILSVFVDYQVRAREEFGDLSKVE
jgi:hypothetical protein